ncbi:hypothetical protein J6590_002407 [Homalodisca vitripennis]|nr:hypothetical protein J6590_002407 [Homalodisca vitripennis]
MIFFTYLFNLALNRHVCPDCGKSYSLATNLQRHRKFQCQQEPKFKCPFCPKRSALKFNLVPHVKSKHPDQLDLYYIMEGGAATASI